VERHPGHALGDKIAPSEAGIGPENEETSRRSVRVYRLVLIKDGEFVRPAQAEQAERAAAS
jgi:hypothetical protein